MKILLIIKDEIKYRYSIINDRLNLFWLFHGEFKKWVLGILYYHEMRFARTKINAQWGDLHDQVKSMTKGDLNLFTGITILEEGIKDEKQFDKYNAIQKEMLELTIELLEEIRKEEAKL